MTDKEAMLKLIDIVGDLNESVDMLIDKVDTGGLSTTCLFRKINADISDDLRELTKHYS